MLKFFSTLTAALILQFVVFYPVQAQPEEVKSAREDANQSFDKLSETEERILSPEEKEKLEFDLKKSALDKVITLSILETKNIKGTLQNLNEDEAFVEAEMITLKKIFLSGLEDRLRYLEAIRQDFPNLKLDLNELKRFAGNFNEWRETTYVPEIKKVFDLILVFRNNSLVSAANARFTSMAREVKEIQSSNLYNLIWQKFLNAAALDIKEARENNNRALALLNDYLPKPEQSSNEALALTAPLSSPEPEAGDLTKDKPVVKKADVRDLVFESLNKLKEAYGKFIEVRGIIKVLR